jgi:uncharacterized protein
VTVTVPPRVSLVTLGVADVARATAFYTALGWEASPMSQESITFLRTTGPVVALWGWDDLAEEAGAGRGAGARDSFRGASLSINLESVEAVDAAVAAWVAAGGRVVVAPHTMDWGGYSGYVADVDDHLWELAHNPYVPFLPNGLLDLP